jgi:two-component system sensor histidine kinase/response regulator
MTANAMQADKDRCLAAGMNGFVSKPINPDELWRALLSWIKMRAGLGTPAGQAVATVAVPSARADQLVSALRSVESLEVDRGLQLSNHNAALYVSMLARFVKSQAGAVASIQQALLANDWATAERLAHTLKGLAASVGAPNLQEPAAELEKALHTRADASRIQALLEPTQMHLQVLVDGLRQTPGLLEDAPQSDSAELTDAQGNTVLAVVQQLQQMLQQDDPEAAVLWDTHAHVLRAALPQAQAVEDAIQGFAFDEALKILQGI